jgi:hypothetical protein
MKDKKVESKMHTGTISEETKEKIDKLSSYVRVYRNMLEILCYTKRYYLPQQLQDSHNMTIKMCKYHISYCNNAILKILVENNPNAEIPEIVDEEMKDIMKS